MQVYSVRGMPLCLTGTAEVPLGAVYMDCIVPEEQLPIRLAAFGHCFRTEAGSAGAALPSTAVHTCVKAACGPDAQGTCTASPCAPHCNVACILVVPGGLGIMSGTGSMLLSCLAACRVGEPGAVPRAPV